MKITPLPNSRHFTHKTELTFADLITAGTSQPTNLIPVVSGMLVVRVGFRLRIPFSGGAATALTLSLGDAGSAARYLAALSIWGAAAPIAAAGSNAFFAYTAAENFRAVFTSTGANLNTITAGKVDVYVTLADLNEADAV